MCTHAARKGHGDVVEVLLGAGANPAVEDRYSETAADEADQPALEERLREAAKAPQPPHEGRRFY
jgi:ankyrin repeat protein